jgi:predicted Rossmann-fold nucleotide-binding protein
MLQVLAAGTWRDNAPAEYTAAAFQVGRLLAEAGVDLAAGSGSGIVAHIAAGFRSVSGRSGVVRLYLPAAEHIEVVGEVVRYDLADETVQTGVDYLQRNMIQVRACAGMVAVTGGDGTLGELGAMLGEMRRPVGVLAGSGPAACALPGLLEWFPDWRPLVLLDADPVAVARFVLDRLTSATPPASP